MKFLHLLIATCLLTLVASAQTATPFQWLNVKTLGALGNGTTDDTVAIQAAIAAVKLLPAPAALYFPSGTYCYSKNMKIDGIAVFGAGMSRTVLKALDAHHTSWMLTGSAPSIRDLSILDAVPGTTRDTTAAGVGLDIYQAQNFSVSRVAIGPLASAAILVRGSGGTTTNPAYISNCSIKNMLADGIHITGASHDIDILHNDVSMTGDDLIAVVSYRYDAAPCSNIYVGDNVIGTQTDGRGISVVGGTDITIDSNDLETTFGAGIYLASEAAYDTYADTRISVINNTLVNTSSNAALGQGAIHLCGRVNPAGGSPFMISTVTIDGNRVYGASKSGLYIGAYSSGVNVTGNLFDSAVSSAVSVGPTVSNIAIGTGVVGAMPNVITSCGEYGIQVDPTGSTGTLRISGVLLQSINTKGLSYVDAINIKVGGTYTSTYITDNRLEMPANLHVERFIESNTAVTQALRNTASTIIGSFIAAN